VGVELGITPFFIRSRHEADQDKKWLSKHGIGAYGNIMDVACTLK
jgi:D-glycero-D-manno-heptose 1,7-bisphosphate phosphatase